MCNTVICDWKVNKRWIVFFFLTKAGKIEFQVRLNFRGGTNSIHFNTVIASSTRWEDYFPVRWTMPLSHASNTRVPDCHHPLISVTCPLIMYVRLGIFPTPDLA